MNTSDFPIKVVIRKDDFRPSRPWCADIIFPAGPKWVSWCHGFRTLRGLNAHIDATSASEFERVRA
jgi:hypothetical protein